MTKVNRAPTTFHYNCVRCNGKASWNAYKTYTCEDCGLSQVMDHKIRKFYQSINDDYDEINWTEDKLYISFNVYGDDEFILDLPYMAPSTPLEKILDKINKMKLLL